MLLGLARGFPSHQNLCLLVDQQDQKQQVSQTLGMRWTEGHAQVKYAYLCANVYIRCTPMLACMVCAFMCMHSHLHMVWLGFHGSMYFHNMYSCCVVCVCFYVCMSVHGLCVHLYVCLSVHVCVCTCAGAEEASLFCSAGANSLLHPRTAHLCPLCLCLAPVRSLPAPLTWVPRPPSIHRVVLSQTQPGHGFHGVLIKTGIQIIIAGSGGGREDWGGELHRHRKLGILSSFKCV